MLYEGVLMALYYYQAFSKDGKKVKGQVDASSFQHAKELITQRDLFIISIELSSDTAKGLPWYKKIIQKKADLKDRILFTKQLAVLLKSGVPILQSLELLVEQFEGQMKSIIIDVKDGVKEGKSLADGLKKYPKVFDNTYVQLIRAGEATGKLETILDRLSTFLERQDELRKKVKSALRGPLIELSVLGVVASGLIVGVVPKLVGVFKSQGKALPLPTVILLAISDFVLNHYIILALLIALAVGSFVYLKSTEWGQLFLDKVKLKMPIVSYFTQMGAVAQFCRTLGMLLESGVNLSDALDIVSTIIDNKVLTTVLIKAKDKIIKEGKITQYLSETKIFPPMAIYLLKTGEQSGELAHMLLVVAQNYEADLSEYSDSLSSKLKPFMTITMALLIGFVVLSIMLPIINMSQLVGV